MKVTLGHQSDYIVATLEGQVTATNLRHSILESAFKANAEDLRGIIFVMSRLPAFDPTLREIYEFVQCLSNSLPKSLRYVFFGKAGSDGETHVC